MAMALPVAGMMLGAKGLVVALPVTDADAALAALETIFPEHEAGEVQHTFRKEDGTPLTVELREGYLVAGANPTMLKGFELDVALSGAGLPPGSLALDLRLEPVAPMLQAAMEQGRQVAKQQMAAKAEAEAEEEGEAPFEAENLNAMLDLYFDVLRDAVANVARIQLSVEITPDHGIFHKRLVPIAGSTLDGFVSAQDGGFPEIAKLIRSDGDMMGAVANLKQTPESTAALKGYFHTYVEAMGRLFEAIAEEQPASAQFGKMMAQVEPLLDPWFECQRGDLAMSFSLDPESGMEFTEIVGAANAEVCETVMAQSVELYKAIETAEGAEPWITMNPAALSHAGVEAYMQKIDFGAIFAGAEAEADQMAAIQAMMGGDSMESFVGIRNDLMLVAGGAGAEERFKELVDLAGKTKKWKKGQGALTEASFAPLQVGPGFFAYVDLGRMLANMAEMMDEYADEFGVLAALEPDQRRIVYGGRFANGSMTIEFALPFEMIRTLRAAVEEEEHEHEHEGGEEHDHHGEGEVDVYEGDAGEGGEGEG
jgi:hypothetical protein